MDISGITAIVTGGASGLGAATAMALNTGGAHVTILDRDATQGRLVENASGGDIVFAQVDVTDPDHVRQAVAAAAERGPLRVAINCAGIAIGERTLDRDGNPAELGQFERVLRVNLFGTYNVATQAASTMARTEPLEHGERGVIISTASVAAYEGQIGQTAYAASKGAVVAMTLPMARDLSTVGIRVNTIAPGIIDTNLLAGLNEDVRESLARGVPFPKRLGHPTDYAQLVLAIIDNGYINGETIRMDGALRMAPR